MRRAILARRARKALRALLARRARNYLPVGHDARRVVRQEGVMPYLPVQKALQEDL